MEVRSTVKLNWPRIRQLSEAAVTALEQTADALFRTEIVQAQVMPFDTGHLEEDATFEITVSLQMGGYPSYPVRRMRAVSTIIRNITSRSTRTRLQVESGSHRGFREVLTQISHKTHSRNFIRKQVVSDADITGDPAMDR